MDKPKAEPTVKMVQCPPCQGRGKPGVFTWFICAYCDGTGAVTEKRYYRWHQQSSKYASSNPANPSPQETALPDVGARERPRLELVTGGAA